MARDMPNGGKPPIGSGKKMTTFFLWLGYQRPIAAKIRHRNNALQRSKRRIAVLHCTNKRAIASGYRSGERGE
jgi:hypothetical protein